MTPLWPGTSHAPPNSLRPLNPVASLAAPRIRNGDGDGENSHRRATSRPASRHWRGTLLLPPWNAGCGMHSEQQHKRQSPPCKQRQRSRSENKVTAQNRNGNPHHMRHVDKAATATSRSRWVLAAHRASAVISATGL
ncbi:hypothetical protein T440DRAFT_479760 [Plenodomus tracheiphilus IPT5]|uniref:Uncharacterized protein n=1 Tax=Plenodomus tracheiphilus IPT5 TaxID=1408161 RepID=A0A6A7B3A6_9PLEO|nr:hypothetical protein T440DRAFT_479760 [Plenodomus tracheiphilus IPT5]